MEREVESFDHHGFLLSPSLPSASVSSSLLETGEGMEQRDTESVSSPPSNAAGGVPTMISSPSCHCTSNHQRMNGKKRRPVWKKDLVNEIWTDLLNGWKENSTKRHRFAKLESLLHRGVPGSIRPQLWKTLLDSETLAAASKFDYKSNVVALREQLVDLGLSEYGGKAMLMALNQMSFEKDTELLKKGMLSVRSIRQIMADLDRTYPTHRKFMGKTPEAKEGRAALFRVLAVYARYNKQVGYCQGMAYIAGMFLMLMGEEDTFWCLVSLLERHKYLLGYFDTNLSRIQMHGSVFSRLLRKRHPRLAKHLSKLGIEVLMFITPWFMSLFTCLPCWDTVLAIWDLLIVKGFTSIFQASLAIISLCEEKLLKKHDMSTLLPDLLHLPHHVIARATLIPVIQATVVEKWEIDSVQAVINEENFNMDRKRRRPDQENVDAHDQQAKGGGKRQKTSNGTPKQGLFGKIVNMVSWSNSKEPLKKQSTRHRPIIQSRQRVPGKVRNTSDCGYPFELHISPCQEAVLKKRGRKSDNRIIPPRRSPRVALLALTHQNSGQAVDRLVGKSAGNNYAFREFITPVPLRRTQKILASQDFVSSPEVELKPMTSK